MLAATKTYDVSNLYGHYFNHVYLKIIRKRLATCGLNAYVCRKKPLLTVAHKKKRLEWAQAHAHWAVENWKSVVISDVSKFNLVVIYIVGGGQGKNLTVDI